MSDPAPRIIDLPPDDPDLHRQAAQLLVDGFRDHWPHAWPTLEDALEEVRECARGDRSAWAALDAEGAVAGWIGGIRMYDGNVWELHPLVVRAADRGRGLGRALVEHLAAEARAAGALTLWLGTDDEAGLTTLGGQELFPGVLEHVRALRDLHGHPFRFYERVGFELAGVVPDANGFGKPDILMARSLRPRPAA